VYWVLGPQQPLIRPWF